MFGRGWKLTMQSWSVVASRPALLVLPLISFALTLLTVVILLGPWALDLFHDHSHVQIAVAAAVCAYPVAFISVFFNVAFYAMADALLQGREMSLGEALRFAISRLRTIALWTLLTTAVGLTLRLLEQIPGAGGLAVRLAEIVANAAWAIASYFVVPALAVEDIGVKDALGESVRTIRARWGESVTGAALIGGATGLACIPVMMLGAIGLAVFVSGSTVAGGLVMAIAVVLFGALMAFQAAVSNVFRLAVYRYATTGLPSGPFAAEDMDAAFKKKNRFL